MHSRIGSIYIFGQGGGEGCEGVELLRFGEFYFHKCENLIFFAACSCPIIITNHDLYTKQIEKLWRLLVWNDWLCLIWQTTKLNMSSFIKTNIWSNETLQYTHGRCDNNKLKNYH